MEIRKSPMTKAVDRLMLIMAAGPLLWLVYRVIPDDTREKGIIAQAIIDIGDDYLKV